MCRSGSVSTITRAVERYHASRGGNLPPATFRIQPVQTKRNTYRHVIPTEMKWSGGIFPSCKLYLRQVISATWVDSSTPLRCGRNDNFGAFLRIRLLFLQHFTLPCGPHQARPLGRASFPRGKLLFRIGWAPFESDGDISGTSPERHTGRSLWFRWWAVPFIHTGYICNVAWR